MTYVVPIYLAYILAFYLAFYLTHLFYHVSSGISFCTIFFPAFYLAYVILLHSIWHFIWHSIWHIYIYILTIHLDFVLMCVVTLSNINVLTRYLPCILSSIYSDWHFIIYPMCCWYFILHTHTHIYIYIYIYVAFVIWHSFWQSIWHFIGFCPRILCAILSDNLSGISSI